jgi:hypothetical protein
MTMNGSGFLADFGLLDNPFNPSEFNGIDPWALDNLSGSPLRLDEEPLLRQLFIDEAGTFEETLKRFDKALAGKQYTASPIPQLGKKSLFIKITGKKGTGKTTLANEMVRKLQLCAPNKTDVGVFRAEGQYISVREFKERIGKLPGEIAGARPELPCVIMDDTPFAQWTLAEDLFNKIQAGYKKQMAFIVILSDVEALRRGTLQMAGKFGWDSFTTANLSALQAVSLVCQRVSLFRPPPLRDHLSRLGLEAFPFDPEDIKKCLAAPGGSLEKPGLVTLRTLHQVLERSLQEMLGEFEQIPDLTRATADELRGRLIGLKREYLREIEAALHEPEPESFPRLPHRRPASAGPCRRRAHGRHPGRRPGAEYRGGLPGLGRERQ